MKKLNTLVSENNLKLLSSSPNLESSRQSSLFELAGERSTERGNLLSEPKRRSKWAREFVNTHELSFSNLKSCDEFYKLNKQKQDSVRYQLKRISLSQQQETSLNNLTIQEATATIIDSKKPQFRPKLGLSELKNTLVSFLLYGTLALVVGLLTAESFTYYFEARGMSFGKAMTFSCVVELMLLILFSSSQKKIRLIGWAVFFYSTATCGLWLLHLDAKRNDDRLVQVRKENLLENEISALKDKAGFTEKEIELLIKAQQKLVDMGHLSKSLRVGEEIKKQKDYLSSIFENINVLKNKNEKKVTLVKAGTFEADSYSQFGLRVLFQIFVANFSSILGKERKKKRIYF